jgi:hypothetical protein
MKSSCFTKAFMSTSPYEIGNDVDSLTSFGFDGANPEFAILHALLEKSVRALRRLLQKFASHLTIEPDMTSS